MGRLLIHRDGLGALPAYPAEQVIDPTGAGDTFAGGMMGRRSRADGGKRQSGSFGQVLRALAHGTVIASFNIEKFSLDRLKTLTRRELGARYAEYSKMIRVHGVVKTERAGPEDVPRRRRKRRGKKRRR